MKREPRKRPRVASDLVIREVDGEVFLYEPRRDRVSLINSSAAFILSLCDGTRSEQEISAEARRRFDQKGPDVDEEIRSTLAEFRLQGVIVSARAGDQPESGE